MGAPDVEDPHQEDRERNEERVNLVDLPGEGRDVTELLPPFKAAREDRMQQRHSDEQVARDFKQRLHVF